MTGGNAGSLTGDNRPAPLRDIQGAPLRDHLGAPLRDHQGAPLRDTDADWQAIGSADPFWGVLTQPQFRRDRMQPADLDAFYQTGVVHITGVVEIIEMITQTRFHARSALDFGCGVGRLAEAMAAHADQTTAYDISPGMLAAARARGLGQNQVTYTNEFPAAGRFDWINSYIVFQHIPPVRGMALLQQLLDRLLPGGVISLHFMIYRDPPPPAPGARRSRLRHLPAPLRDVIRGLRARHTPPPLPLGTISMYDYDLNRLLEACNRAGINRLYLAHGNHGGHHGVIIFGRREVPAG